MHNATKFFPGFHHRLFGRKPLTAGTQLARAARRADTLCLTQLHTLFEGVLPPWLATFKTARGSNSRHCTYTTLVSFWAFLCQVLDPDGSCRRAVTRVQTLCSALGLTLPDEDTGAYCVARSRLLIRVGPFGARPTPGRHVADVMTCCKPSLMILSSNAPAARSRAYAKTARTSIL